MDNKDYRYFDKDVTITGKHARYLDEMWTQNQIDEKSYFNRLYELYVLAALVGVYEGRTALNDISDDKRTIQPGQIISLPQLKEAMKIVLLLDKTKKWTDEEKVNRAFRGPKSDVEYSENMDLFNSYARGGIEILYEDLALRQLDLNDEYTDLKVGNIMAFLRRRM